MDKLKLTFATHNQHKLFEVQKMLATDKLILQSLTDIGCTEDIEENALTLEGNARIKARYIHSQYGLNCFADDTGLEIEALNGEPGVFSARYAGAEKSGEANMQKVLQKLHGISNRKARFRTALVLILDNEEYLFEGKVEGEIIDKPRGSEGFGYDPIFVPVGYKQTFAEMPLQEKNTISHRYKAIAMLRDYLASVNYF